MFSVACSVKKCFFECWLQRQTDAPQWTLDAYKKSHLSQLTSFTPWGHKAPLIFLFQALLFSSLVCQREKVSVCMCARLHMLVPISPSSPLSPSPHIQMSLHLSCKCLPVCMICECMCVFFAISQHPLFILCINLHVCLLQLECVSIVCMCVTRSWCRLPSPCSQ